MSYAASRNQRFFFGFLLSATTAISCCFMSAFLLIICNFSMHSFVLLSLIDIASWNDLTLSLHRILSIDFCLGGKELLHGTFCTYMSLYALLLTTSLPGTTNHCRHFVGQYNYLNDWGEASPPPPSRWNPAAYTTHNVNGHKLIKGFGCLICLLCKLLTQNVSMN